MLPLPRKPALKGQMSSAVPLPVLANSRRACTSPAGQRGFCQTAGASPSPAGDNSVPSQYSGVPPHSESASQPAQPEPSTERQLFEPPKTLGRRIRYFFLGDGLDKKRLRQLGVGAVASYGMVSNLTYCTGLAVSWIAFVQQRHLSPLMPGQWKPFLAFYAGFWTIQNFLRPLRFSLALTLAPAFNRFISFLEVRLHLRRQLAFGVYIALLGAVTSLLTFGSIFAVCGPAAYARA